MNLKKILSASLSSAVILMSPGLGAWQALAEQVGAESNGSAERLSSENLGITAGDSVGSAADIPIETPAEILGTGDFVLPSIEASDRPSRDEDSGRKISARKAKTRTRLIDADETRALLGKNGPGAAKKERSAKPKARRSKALDEAKNLLEKAKQDYQMGLADDAQTAAWAKTPLRRLNRKLLGKKPVGPAASPFGRQIQSILKGLALNREELSQLSGLKPGTIERWEKGEKPSGMADVLLQALGKIAASGNGPKLVGEFRAAAQNGTKLPQSRIMEIAFGLDAAKTAETKQAVLNQSLLDAASKGDLVQVKTLLDQGADPNARDHHKYEETPLMKTRYIRYDAPNQNGVEIAQLLLNRGADLNAQNMYGQTLLILATDNLDLVKFLVERGADMNVEDSRGHTALMYASITGRFEIAKLLVEHGAQTTERDQDGMTALGYARDNGHEQIASLLEPAANQKADKPSQNALNEALLDAAFKGDLGLVQSLLDQGADVNARDKFNETPLMKVRYIHFNSADKDGLDVAELLLSRGADINAQDKYGRTLLMLATDDPVLTKFLVERGANIGLRDKDGHTAVMDAIYYRHWPAAKFLLSRGASPLQAAGAFVYRSLDLVFMIAQVLVKFTIPQKLDHLAYSFLHSRPVQATLKAWRTLTGRQKALDEVLITAAGEGDENRVFQLKDQGADVNAEEADGTTPLMAAIHAGYNQLAGYLMNMGASVDGRDHTGTTALFRAASTGNVEGVNLLLDRGADINAKDVLGDTALLNAAYLGRENSVLLLLERGADPTIKNNEGKTALDFAKESSLAAKTNIVKTLRQAALDKEVIAAALEGDLAKVRSLLDSGANLNARDYAGGPTALMYASANGRIDVVDLLLDCGADVNARRTHGTDPQFGTVASALTWAAENNQAAVVRLLLAHDAKGAFRAFLRALGNALRGESGGWQTAKVIFRDSLGGQLYWTETLQTAAVEGDYYAAKAAILRGAVIDFPDTRSARFGGMTALTYAAFRGHIDIVKLLLDKGALINGRDRRGNLALTAAASNGQTEAVKLLLDRGATIDAANDGGQTALFLAALNRHDATVQLLLERGAALDVKSAGETALDVVKRLNYPDIALILEQAARKKQDSLNEDLLIAAAAGNLEKVKVLVGEGADLKAKNPAGMTALAAAKDMGQSDVAKYLEGRIQKSLDEALLDATRKGSFHEVRVLVAQGADVNAKSDQGSTPLSWATYRNHLSMVRFLVGRKADVNARDRFGFNALGGSAKKASVVKFLLDRGIDPNAKNNDGFTQLMWAARAGNVETTRLLLDRGATKLRKAFFAAGSVQVAALIAQEVLRRLFRSQEDLAANPLQAVAGETLRTANSTPRPEKPEAKLQEKLVEAAAHGTSAQIEALLEQGADVDGKAFNGWTSLMWAAFRNRPESIKTLLDRKANIEAAIPKGPRTGMTSLMIAAEEGHLDVVQILLKRGGDRAAKDGRGRTALDYARENRREEIVRLLELPAQNELARAIIKGDLAAVRSLLTKGVNVNGQDINGLTPLIRAAFSNETKIAKLLLDKGAYVNSRSLAGGQSPLMAAAVQGHAEMVRLLLKRGADVNAKDAKGLTSLDFAKKFDSRARSRQETVKLLARAIKLANKKPSDKEISALGESYAKEMKNIRHSETEYEQARSNQARWLRERGATERQIELFYAAGDAIANPEGFKHDSNEF